MKKVAKISQSTGELANTLNPGVNEDDIKELLWVVFEELTNEELLEPGQEFIAEEEARENRRRARTQETHSGGLAEAFAALNKLLKNFKT